MAFCVACLALGLGVGNIHAQESSSLPEPAGVTVDYIKDVQPIFKGSCYQCHGPNKQKGGLRLDVKSAFMQGGDTGPAIVLGKSAESLLIHNVARLGDASPMPPTGKPLEPDQIALLRAWIDQGANWPDELAEAAHDPTKHWSFVAPVRPALPSVTRAEWPRNPIDRFVLARLEKEGLSPSAEADRVTLIRRLHLDLLGLPPSPEAVDQFVADTRPDAYERLVDRLLASPHYGERWARRWLDAARYADTNGYEKDRDREIWAWRDWVINALNQDLPFDEFTIEQLAGDMLPGATKDQIIATGFHRNTMINEEGGIDVEQFRYESVVDRVKTTGDAFLGLSVGCAQCHDHKFDPISHKEYFQIFAFLNNADEPHLEVATPDQVLAREDHIKKVASLESELASKFPPYQEEMVWTVLDPTERFTTNGVVLERQDDKSVLATGENPTTETYTIIYAGAVEAAESLRIEALADDRLPSRGPGRVGHGNFVLSELRAVVEGPSGPREIKFASATAAFSQDGFGVAGIIDGNAQTGWAVAGAPGGINRDHEAILKFAQPLTLSEGERIKITLEQTHGDYHTIGKLRISAGKLVRSHYHPELSDAEQRAKHLSAKYETWLRTKEDAAVKWTALEPVSVKSVFGATMTELDDKSVLVSGDKPNKDIYEAEFVTDLKGITGLRLEVLPHESLPLNGPGRGDVVGKGNFMLSEFEAYVGAADSTTTMPLEFQNPTADFVQGGRSIEQTIDGSKETGWAIDGGQGRSHQAVYEFKTPVSYDANTRLVVNLIQYFIHQDTIGRFRISVTTDPLPLRAVGLDAELEAALQFPPELRTGKQTAELKRQFLLATPELAAAQKEISDLRKRTPELPTTMVMKERDAPRVTRIHHRGEFLSPKEEVGPGIPAVLPGMPEGVPLNRLAFARWLVDGRNPLVSRVTVNRAWESFFGRGIVPTVSDFGTMGELPSHPELLDWLAVEFMKPTQFRKPWSMKELHRLIVTSTTYRQSSRVTPEALERDPGNVWLARGPRMRVEAEVVRDIALSVSGLMNPKLGGPSVYPPQPPGVTELAYGSPRWNVSAGAEKYRRGLYTFFKRSAPYPGMTVFDAPTADMTCTRRARSNTPLQALTTLNDAVFVEAAQAFARRVLDEEFPTSEQRMQYAFRLALSRAPEQSELKRLLSFHEQQLARAKRGEIEAAKLALAESALPPADYDIAELAAWTSVTRALLNLDETITKE